MWPDCSRDPDGLALLRAALAQPAGDTPRMVLADWLQEHDEEAVAVALRESIGIRDEWGDFPDEVQDRWSPWNAILDGWVVIRLMRWPLPENLSDSPWITFLDLSSTGATDTMLKELAGLTNLTTLDLRYTQVTDTGLKELAALKHLTTLSLVETDVTDAGLKELAAFTNLTTLNLSRLEITDAGLKELAALTNLTDLDLGDTDVTDAGVKELATLTNLTSLHLHGCWHVTDAGLRELAALTSLTTLNLLTVTDQTLAVLREINLLHALSQATAADGKRPTKPEEITTLNLSYDRKVSNPRVTDAGLKELAELTNLTTLSLYGTQVTDAGVAELQMVLPKCKITK